MFFRFSYLSGKILQRFPISLFYLSLKINVVFMGSVDGLVCGGGKRRQRITFLEYPTNIAFLPSNIHVAQSFLNCLTTEMIRHGFQFAPPNCEGLLRDSRELVPAICLRKKRLFVYLSDRIPESDSIREKIPMDSSKATLIFLNSRIPGDVTVWVFFKSSSVLLQHASPCCYTAVKYVLSESGHSSPGPCI